MKKPISDLQELLANMQPVLNQGEYIFATVSDINTIPRDKTICEFVESEGVTVVMSKADAVALGLSFDFVASWITLNIHSALDAIGLTAAFSGELAKYDMSCNVMAGYYHDHIFVEKKDEQKALKVLWDMTTQ